MCQPRQARPQRDLRSCACGCCGCGCGPHFRRFYSAGEEREWLETYTDQLKKELAGVEERMRELCGE